MASPKKKKGNFNDEVIGVLSGRRVYDKSILNPRGDTHVGVRSSKSFPFFETYNYTPLGRSILQEQRKKKPRGMG